MTKQNFKSTKIFTMVMALVMAITILVPCISVQAAGIRYFSINTSTSWTTIATAGSGFDCNVESSTIVTNWYPASFKSSTVLYNISCVFSKLFLNILDVYIDKPTDFYY